jgi:ferritin-like metal-binding protein YciE
VKPDASVWPAIAALPKKKPQFSREESAMPISNSQEKFVHELADVYDAEHQFLEAMGTMREKASDEKLQTMLTEHMQQTEEQIIRLEQVFSEIGQEPERQECMGAKGLIEEASKMMEEAGTDELRDTIIVGGATKAEHYEMVSYADLIEGAELLKLRKAVKLLTENREEEVSTARKLERLSPRLGKAAA